MIERGYHISFPASDVKRTGSFYENVLGLKKTGEWPNYATFDVGGVQFGFGLDEELEIFLIVDDVDQAYQTLKEKGAKFLTEPKDQHSGARTATLVDPDGNRFTIETSRRSRMHCSIML